MTTPTLITADEDGLWIWDDWVKAQGTSQMHWCDLVGIHMDFAARRLIIRFLDGWDEMWEATFTQVSHYWANDVNLRLDQPDELRILGGAGVRDGGSYELGVEHGSWQWSSSQGTIRSLGPVHGRPEDLS